MQVFTFHTNPALQIRGFTSMKYCSFPPSPSCVEIRYKMQKQESSSPDPEASLDWKRDVYTVNAVSRLLQPAFYYIKTHRAKLVQKSHTSAEVKGNASIAVLRVEEQCNPGCTVLCSDVQEYKAVARLWVQVLTFFFNL